MTVNYTTNLALGQPVTGTESGTWGDDVNNAVTSYLDIAIAGGLAITVTTADVTLTLTQGTSSATNIGSTTAQYAILNVSGAMTAARSLIVPSSSRIYLINNNTTGGFALTVKGSATSGVTLVNGEKAQVFWNGSDYAKLSNASGGAGVFSSITNSGLTSGRVVYSTTGGLETDSANLTFNGTTLTAGGLTTTGTTSTGVLSVTGNTTLGDASTDTVTVNGYVGVGGAASSDNGIRLTSSVLIGATQHGIISLPTISSSATTAGMAVSGRVSTAATAFTSTNIHALYAYDAIKGAGSTITNQHGLYINDQTQGTNNYGITSAVTSGTNKFNIYASGTADNYFAGDVGIGTSSPTSKLHVLGSTSDVFRLERDASNQWRFQLSSGALLFSDAIAAAERMRIDSSGNVGIGTSSPTSTLSVTGTANVTGNVILGSSLVVYAPTPAAISTGATLTNANLQTQLIDATGGTGTFTLTMPLGTTLETLVSWSAVNLGYDFSIICNSSQSVILAVNTGVTSVGTLVVSLGTSARFRIRRTAANTFVLYRIS